GYAKYAPSIADSILIGDTQPPLTIGIQAPWGQGKTSLMRMIQARLDPHSDDAESHSAFEVKTTYSWFFHVLKLTRRTDIERVPLITKKEIPTVWFNPLYYRETSQVWAGLAHAILHQLAAQIEKPAAREEFWLRLQLGRINIDAVRRDVVLWILRFTIPFALMWIAIGAAIASSNRFAGGIIGFLAAVAQIWGALKK